MDLIEIKDNLNAAQDYLESLHTLDAEVEQAQQQILSTTKQSCENVEVIFNEIVNNISNCLNNRKKFLLQQILDIQQEALLPLKDCRKVVTEKIENTSQFIKLGTQLVKSSNIQDLEDFNNKARLLGSLPEVPDLKEVPYVSFHHEPTVESELLDVCSNLGAVSRIAPVQICATMERPGSILVEWRCTDIDERSGDIQSFRLQKAYGNVNENKHLTASFNDCYIGADLQYLVKDLQCNQEYSFQVCCKYEGSSFWSQWSVPHIAVTNIPKFSWKKSSELSLTNENTIVKPVIDKAITIFSNGPQISSGYSIEFTFLECDVKKSDVYVGISAENISSDIQKIKNNAFLLEANGDILINGQVKSTKLPEVAKGSKVCFTCEKCGEDKLRINVDSNDKRVTYDWSGLENTEKLVFVASLNSNKWKIMVE